MIVVDGKSTTPKSIGLQKLEQRNMALLTRALSVHSTKKARQDQSDLTLLWSKFKSFLKIRISDWCSWGILSNTGS